MGCSMPGFPVHHQLQEPTQTHVHLIGDAIQPFHPLVVPFSSRLQSFPAITSLKKCEYVLGSEKGCLGQTNLEKLGLTKVNSL